MQHEARDEIDEKNLLQAGAVTPDEVIRLLLACRGQQYSCSRHHHIASIDVHVFKPEASLKPGSEKCCWYIKLYFVEPDAWFVSVHQSRKG